MVKKRQKEIDQTLLVSAFKIAKAACTSVLFLYIDPLKDLPSETPPKGCRVIYVTRRSSDEIDSSFTENSKAVIYLPNIPMTRIGLIKMSVVLALSRGVVTMGEKIVFLSALPDGEFLDNIFFIDTSREEEIITSRGVDGITSAVRPEVFQQTLNIALELASHGREGKPVGTIFVLGDEDKVMQLSKQMIINPFKGYTDEERSILDPRLKETLFEFSALDGAIVISEDGLVLTAGRHLGAAGAGESTPRGLGSRHIAAAGITALTKAVAIVISESSGDLRIFQNGKVLLEIEKPIGR